MNCEQIKGNFTPSNAHAQPDPSDTGPHIFISVAEQSADMHAASLIRAVRACCPVATFHGIAGPAMQEAGCESFYDMTSRSAMLLAAAGSFFHVLRLRSRVKAILRTGRFDAAVFLDSPALNLGFAKMAKKQGVPVLYYIAPQLWAWGRYRIGKVRRCVDRLACILPFEESFFRSYGVDASYVGHPLADHLADVKPDQAKVAQLRQAGSPRVALLPGSRRHVVMDVFPGQLAVCAAIARKFPEAAFLVSVANPQCREVIAPAAANSGLSISLHEGSNVELLEAADLALVASGTATLETAFLGKPMIVMYNSSKWGYRLVGRFMIRTRHLCLVNILAGRELVPEFMPYYTSTDPIAARAVELLSSPQRLSDMAGELDRLVAPLRRAGAAKTVANMLLEMVKTR